MVFNLKLQYAHVINKFPDPELISFWSLFFYIHVIWLLDKCNNRLLRMRLTNKQNYWVLKYDAVYFDASEGLTASIHV